MRVAFSVPFNLQKRFRFSSVMVQKSPGADKSMMIILIIMFIGRPIYFGVNLSLYLIFYLSIAIVDLI